MAMKKKEIWHQLSLPHIVTFLQFAALGSLKAFAFTSVHIILCKNSLQKYYSFAKSPGFNHPFELPVTEVSPT